MNNLLKISALTVALAMGAPQVADAATATRNVQFARGAEATTVSSAVRGYNTIHYKINARAGQRMTLRMTSRYPVYFNVYAPGQTPGRSTAMYNSSTSGDTYSVVLPRSGTYTVQVYQMRASARRNANYPFSLRVEIPRRPTAGQPPINDGGHGPDYWEVTNVTYALNVRAGASTNSAVVGTVRRGTVLRNEGCNSNASGTWCKVESMGGGATVRGWVSNHYLREASFSPH